MSKKEKKKNRVMNFDESIEDAALFTGADLDEDGFFILRPTEEGRRRISASRPKLRVVEAEDYDQRQVLAAIGYDMENMIQMVNKLEDVVRQGKFTKGVEFIDRAALKVFIDELEKLDPANKMHKAHGPMFDMARRLITIGKSYYEYDPEVRNIFSDTLYDRLIAAYNKTGNPEPTGIIPKGLKILRKAEQNYKTLHNNMDKSYIIREGESIPAGVKETDSVEAFLTRVFKECGIPHSGKLTLELSPKEDGVSINGTVRGNRLFNAQTRGDTSESVVVIGLNGYVLNSDEFVNENEDFGVQFEAICTRTNAKAAAKYLKLDEPYKSPRHAAAGIIHRLSTMEDPYLASLISLYPINSEGLPGTYLERMDFLRNFNTTPTDTPHRRLVTGNFSELLNEIEKEFHTLEKKRGEIDYSIDGMVITVAEDEYQNIMGRLGRTNKWQIALKFNPAAENSKADYLRLDSGRKGYRTLQLYLEHPVLLDGVEYDHVPILSVRLFKEHNLRQGSIVNIHRVGDVIPAITVVEEGHGEYLKLPERCPSCGKRLIVKNEKLYCDNSSCPDNLVGILVGFFETVGLDGYSDSFAKMLVEKMKVKSIKDILDLEDEDYEKAECLGALSTGFAEKLKKAISSKKDFELLGAMGIPNMGPARAQNFIKLFAQCRDWEGSGPEQMLTDRGGVRMAITGSMAPSMVEDALDFYWGKWFQKSWKAIAPLITQRVSAKPEKLTRVGHHGGKLSSEVMSVCARNNFVVVDNTSFDILISTTLTGGGVKMNLARKKNIPIFLPETFIGQYGA